jgi:hypothetical protein
MLFSGIGLSYHPLFKAPLTDTNTGFANEVLGTNRIISAGDRNDGCGRASLRGFYLRLSLSLTTKPGNPGEEVTGLPRPLWGDTSAATLVTRAGYLNAWEITCFQKQAPTEARNPRPRQP